MLPSGTAGAACLPGVMVLSGSPGASSSQQPWGSRKVPGSEVWCASKSWAQTLAWTHSPSVPPAQPACKEDREQCVGHFTKAKLTERRKCERPSMATQHSCPFSEAPRYTSGGLHALIVYHPETRPPTHSCRGRLCKYSGLVFSFSF